MNTPQAPRHHPDQFLLSDYAAGSLPGAVALPVAVHLEFCAQCRRDARALCRIGAGLFDAADPVPVGDDALERLLQRIESVPAQAEASSAPRAPAAPHGLPRALAKLAPRGIEALDWKRVSAALHATRLRFGDSRREVALHHIAAGGKVPAHGHAGSEVTVVLRGEFADGDGSYHDGDFICRGPGEVHRPVADAGSDCLCLAVLDAPIRLTGIARVLNPFIRIHPC